LRPSGCFGQIFFRLGHDRAEAILKLHVMQVEAVAARGSFVAADQVLGAYQSDLQLGQRYKQA